MQSAGSDNFEELIDHNYPMIEICGYEYYPSIVFREVDPMSYRSALKDWKSTEAGEIAWELVRMRDGETLPYYECHVTYLAEEENTNV